MHSPCHFRQHYSTPPLLAPLLPVLFRGQYTWPLPLGDGERMRPERLRRVLEDLRSGRITVEEALSALRRLPFEDIGFAKIDLHRELRKGFPEVVLCQGKTLGEIKAIVERMVGEGVPILLTKADGMVYRAVREVAPEAIFHERARIVAVPLGERPEPVGLVLVLTGGTSDIPVAEEAAVTAEFMGSKVRRIYDVGVAGLHRLLSHIEEIHKANVIVAVAGMDGALPSVVGGLTDRPVIAVPTSQGYSTFEGLSALLTMLNSCAPGVVVVNIDNGFGAGYFAHMVNAEIEGARAKGR